MVTIVCWSLYLAMALSSKVLLTTSTPGMDSMAISCALSGVKVFPLTVSTFRSGSKWVKKLAMRSWKPLNTESVHTRANVAKATPQTEMAEMMLMALCDFFEKR